MQTRNNLEKIIVIIAFIAVRLLQLREFVGDKDEAKSISCEQFLTLLNGSCSGQRPKLKKCLAQRLHYIGLIMHLPN
ncbi:hypothetical protein PSOS111911_17580 [Pseudoalteromonas ostreae]